MNIGEHVPGPTCCYGEMGWIVRILALCSVLFQFLYFDSIPFIFPGCKLLNPLYMLLFIRYQLLPAVIGDKNYLWAVKGVYRAIREQVKVSIYCSEYGHGTIQTLFCFIPTFTALHRESCFLPLPTETTPCEIKQCWSQGYPSMLWILFDPSQIRLAKFSKEFIFMHRNCFHERSFLESWIVLLWLRVPGFTFS